MVRKAAKGVLSPRTAIKLKCYECCGYEDYIERSKECQIQRCPLWAYRPGTKRRSKQEGGE